MSQPNLLPRYEHELMATLDPVDAVVLMEPTADEREGEAGLVVGLKRYEPEPYLAVRLPLLHRDIAGGIYVRGEAPWKARVVRTPMEPPSLSVTFILKEPGRVSVYLELGDPTRGNGLRQIVIVAERSSHPEG